MRHDTRSLFRPLVREARRVRRVDDPPAVDALLAELHSAAIRCSNPRRSCAIRREIARLSLEVTP